jgi:hypothetical protein
MKAGSGYPLESIRRLSNFNASLKYITDELYTQTIIFNKRYVALNSTTKSIKRDDGGISIRAVSDFISWCE